MTGQTSRRATKLFRRGGERPLAGAGSTGRALSHPPVRIEQVAENSRPVRPLQDRAVPDHDVTSPLSARGKSRPIHRLGDPCLGDPGSSLTVRPRARCARPDPSQPGGAARPPHLENDASSRRECRYRSGHDRRDLKTPNRRGFLSTGIRRHARVGWGACGTMSSRSHLTITLCFSSLFPCLSRPSCRSRSSPYCPCSCRLSACLPSCGW